MRHRKQGKALSRTSSHRKALLGNLVTSLIEHERIETTHTKAKEAQRVAERLVSHAKTGTLHARRETARVLKDPRAVQKLFADIGPRYTTRNGGYTRVLDLRTRKGDGAVVSLLEFIAAPGQEKTAPAEGSAKEAKSKEKAARGRLAKAARPPKATESARPSAKKSGAVRHAPKKVDRTKKGGGA